MTTSISIPALSPPAAAGRAALHVVFFSVHELGWKTWARQLEAFSTQLQGHARHVPLAMPLSLRLLARSIAGFSLTSERAYDARCIRRHLRQIAGEQPIDVVVASSQRLGPHLVDFCKTSGAKLAICLDTTGPIYTRDLLKQPPKPVETWAEERALYAAADLLVPWSNWARQSLIEDFGVSPEKILLTPPSVDVPQTPPTRPLHRDLPAIVFVGNDFVRKGGPRLIALHQKHFRNRARLHIVSAKAPRKHLQNVVFHGQLPRETVLREILPQSDIFCLPTSHDMSPFALAEAQAQGLPCVSSRLAGIPDLVRDQESGYLVDPADDGGFVQALDNLITLPELRRQMSINAHTHAMKSLNANVNFGALMKRIETLAH